MGSEARCRTCLHSVGITGLTFTETEVGGKPTDEESKEFRNTILVVCRSCATEKRWEDCMVRGKCLLMLEGAGFKRRVQGARGAWLINNIKTKTVGGMRIARLLVHSNDNAAVESTL